MDIGLLTAAFCKGLALLLIVERCISIRELAVTTVGTKFEHFLSSNVHTCEGNKLESVIGSLLG